MMKLAWDPKEIAKIRKTISILTPLLLLSCQKKIPDRFDKLDSDFDKMTQTYLRFNVPTITIDEINNDINYLLIDCRSENEFSISTIEGAVNLPTKTSAKNTLKKYPKNTPIIVFCSIGYRSEKMANFIQKLGYKNTNNLYGSIFEWANRGLPLYHENELTDTIHTFNRSWSKWITNKQLTKTW